LLKKEKKDLESLIDVRFLPPVPADEIAKNTDLSDGQDWPLPLTTLLSQDTD
jgi:hypothetical protein